MERVTFLFGAGAEMCYGMKQGLEFLENAIMGKESKDQRLDALQKFFKGNEDGYSYSKDIVYSKSKFLKTCVFNKAADHTDSDNSFLKKYKDQIFCILSKSSRDELIKELGIKDNNYWDECAVNLAHQEKNGNRSDPYPSDEAANVESKLEEKFEQAMKNEISFEELVVTDKFGNSFDILQGLFKNNETNETNEEIGKKTYLGLSVNLPAGGLLDGYFHTIINPNKHGIRNFFKVFNYYWFCYFTMIEDIINSNVIDTSSLKKYYIEVPDGKDDNNKKRELKYEYILNNISEFTRDLYKLDVNPNTDTYYKLLKEECKERNIKPNIVTTNYYKFCEILVDSKSEEPGDSKSEKPNDSKDGQPIYLNGQLKDFEFPVTLEVQDFEKMNDSISSRKLFFPFIWGQSYVKPIVHSSQIQQYDRFYELLMKNTDILVILGYNINEDDNHINSFLREYVMRKGKRLIVVTSSKDNKGNEDKEDKEDNEDVANKLRCLEEEVNIEYCKVEYGDNQNVIDQLMNLIGV